MLDPLTFQKVSGYEETAWQGSTLRSALASQSMHGSGLSALKAFSGLDLVSTLELSGHLAKSSSMAQLALVKYDPSSAQSTAEVRRHFHDINQ